METEVKNRVMNQEPRMPAEFREMMAPSGTTHPRERGQRIGFISREPATDVVGQVRPNRAQSRPTDPADGAAQRVRVAAEDTAAQRLPN